jgi:hypothetical protein
MVVVLQRRGDEVTQVTAYKVRPWHSIDASCWLIGVYDLPEVGRVSVYHQEPELFIKEI